MELAFVAAQWSWWAGEEIFLAEQGVAANDLEAIDEIYCLAALFQRGQVVIAMMNE